MIALALAWAFAAGATVAYAVALQIGPSCADTVGPWSAGAFFVSFLTLAYLYEKKGMR